MKFTTTLLAALPLLAAAQNAAITSAAAGLSSAVSSALAEATATTPGCEPHGDHWHCDAGVPEPTTPPPAGATVIDDDHSDHSHTDDDDHHTDEAGTGVLGPSPTASVGCEPHGDHWHCEGPRTAVAATTNAGAGAGAATVTTGGPVQQTENAAVGNFKVGAAGVVAAVGGAVMLL